MNFTSILNDSCYFTVPCSGITYINDDKLEDFLVVKSKLNSPLFSISMHLDLFSLI